MQIVTMVSDTSTEVNPTTNTIGTTMCDIVYIDGEPYKVITINRVNEYGVNEPYDEYEPLK
jgi:hypothetical protein